MQDPATTEQSHLRHVEYEPAVPSRLPSGSPSLEMILLGFALGVAVALLLGAPGVAPLLGVASAVVFGAADL